MGAETEIENMKRKLLIMSGMQKYGVSRVAISATYFLLA